LGGQYVDKIEHEFVGGMIKGPTVLEVGTATGRFAASLTQRGAEYVGIDLSWKMLRTTFERTNHFTSLIQMDATKLGLRSYFDSVLCIRTFHFLPKPVEALDGMRSALKLGGQCLVTFETDNFLRRLVLFFGVGGSEQYYYRISDVEEMFRQSGLNPVQNGPVMRIPVTLYRRCPRRLLWILKPFERVWPWPMHEFVLGVKSEALRMEH
jgi:ubiquinone/menaquinone biosynthesis C-methylase UbiE